jgi:hypothetical protein
VLSALSRVVASLSDPSALAGLIPGYRARPAGWSAAGAQGCDEAMVAEVKVGDRGHIESDFACRSLTNRFVLVPPARTGRKGRRPSSSFVQVEATYKLGA